MPTTPRSEFNGRGGSRSRSTPKSPLVPSISAAGERRGLSGTRCRGKTGGDCNSPRASTNSNVAQRCLQGSPWGLKYGHEHEASRFEPRSRSRTRYFEVPRTRATTSPGLAAMTVTRPLTKYDWPRERTASLKFRATFWAIPIIFSRSGRTLQSVWLVALPGWAGTTPPTEKESRVSGSRWATHDKQRGAEAPSYDSSENPRWCREKPAGRTSSPRAPRKPLVRVSGQSSQTGPTMRRREPSLAP